MNTSCHIIAVGAVLLALLPLHQSWAQEGIPPLSPQPQRVPLVPLVDDAQPRDRDEALLLRLRQAVSSRDERIEAMLLERHGDDLPATGSIAVPEADDERQARDRAWHQLQAALAELSSERRRESDILDTPAPLADDRQVKALRARNQLSIARSYKALLEDQEQPSRSELRRAFNLLRELPVEHLATHQRPQHVYLQFWFASELALASTDEENREQFFRAARNAHQQLVNDHSGSVSLVISANTLLNQLQRALQGELSL